MRDLNPIFDIDGAAHILATHQLAAVPRRELGPAIGTLDSGYDVILRAIDILLLTGV